MWFTNRLLWHTNSDFYGIRTPTFTPYEPFILRVGVVSNILTIPHPKGITLTLTKTTLSPQRAHGCQHRLTCSMLISILLSPDQWALKRRPTCKEHRQCPEGSLPSLTGEHLHVASLSIQQETLMLSMDMPYEFPQSVCLCACEERLIS